MKKLPLIIMIILAVAIAAGFVFNDFMAKNLLEREKSYSASLDPAEKNESVFVGLSTPKQWQEDRFHLGAEYDWIIYNNSVYDIESWKVTMTVPDRIEIDSIWNVDYILDGTTLTLMPDEKVDLINAGTHRTFGMILITLGAYELIRPTDIVIDTVVVYKPTQTWLFFVLLIACALWILALIVLFTRTLIKRKMDISREQDRKVILQSMSVFVNFIDAKDPYTNGHSQRVAEYAAEIGRRIKLPAYQVENLYFSALLHDAGKIGVPDSILKKTGRLNAEEFAVIKTHAAQGGEILSGFTAIKEIPEVAHYHHEKYDGTGYPDGLKGEEIPLFARIVCVADSYDAMSSNRCYRNSLEKEVIIAEFNRCTGTQFDPKLVPYILDMIEDGTAERIASAYQMM